jgi:hypothetical protein
LTPSPRLTESIEVPWSQFERSVHDLHRFSQRKHQIPNAVWLGSKPVPPETFPVAMAKIATTGAIGGAPPKKRTIAPARLATEKYVAPDSRSSGRGRSSRRDFIPNTWRN